MKKLVIILGALAVFCGSDPLAAHCQLPCGIYHDDMVFDQIDQYIETMFKGITVMNDSKFTSIHDRNEFIRWVVLKEKESDETARLITTYFLQQKIKPGEEDTAKRLKSAHLLLFYLVQIKQNPDIKIVDQFAHEWDNFKLMFHIEGYECEMEKMKIEERTKEEQKKQTAPAEEAHGHATTPSAKPQAK